MHWDDNTNLRFCRDCQPLVLLLGPYFGPSGRLATIACSVSVGHSPVPRQWFSGSDGIFSLVAVSAGACVMCVSAVWGPYLASKLGFVIGSVCISSECGVWPEELTW